MTIAMDTRAWVQQATRNTIGDALHRIAVRCAEQVALEYRGRRWIYQDLDRAVNRVANRLLALGLHKGDRVAAYGKNSDAYLILWLACTRSGLIHVPVNFSLTERELAYVLIQSGASALFMDDSLQANVDAIAHSLDLVVRGRLHGENADRHEDILAISQGEGEDRAPQVELSDTDVVQILYTSGTTSDPKGAMHTHRSLMAEYASCLLHLDIKATDRCLAALPLYHSAQMHVFTLPSLLAGAFTCVLDTPTPEGILQHLKEQRLNSFFAPPTVWISLLHHPSFVAAELQHLNKLYYGASIMPEPIVQELSARLPQSGLYNCYGQSEIAPLATVLRPEEHQARPASCGRPLMSVETRVVDPATGEVCRPGEQGELVHRSPQLMVGYWGKPDETAEAFTDGWFHSGDLGYQDEQGYVWIVDRIKDIVNTGGVLVASRDVEDVLYTHPEVDEVAVIGVPDEKWIEAIAAVVVLRPEAELDAEELIRHARMHLAPFKVPKQIHFVTRLPKNTSGKLLKRALRQQFS
ncbi:fatty acyl-CoA synthetase [Marinobacterium marinum]|uniref:Long-chain-fatty-acid--CoA ligase n=1 Tax=Marinobacterium marinum TaxID=2756129 RepID=A0A7W1WW41_9GAMM|nr:fatty acyl-CoA synthetase [Marinobacterium marinum]MBA4501320.1 long-chain-fatty-acid--CoA ligase [Marinobacterium marinum]